MTTEKKLTPHGELLEQARKRAGLSQRKAAALAGISDGWWRQVIEGVQKRGGTEVPIHASVEALGAMAKAVGADATAVFDAAGFPAVMAKPYQSNPQGLQPGTFLTASNPDPLARLRFARDQLDAAIRQMEEQRQADGQPGDELAGRRTLSDAADTSDDTERHADVAAFDEREGVVKGVDPGTISR